MNILGIAWSIDHHSNGVVWSRPWYFSSSSREGSCTDLWRQGRRLDDGWRCPMGVRFLSAYPHRWPPSLFFPFASSRFSVCLLASFLQVVLENRQEIEDHKGWQVLVFISELNFFCIWLHVTSKLEQHAAKLASLLVGCFLSSIHCSKRKRYTQCNGCLQMYSHTNK